MPRRKAQKVEISKTDFKRYADSIADYLQFFKGHDADEAKRLAPDMLTFVLNDKDFAGNWFKETRLLALDDRLVSLTDGFFQPTTTDVGKYKFKIFNETTKPEIIEPKNKGSEEEVTAFKRELIREYPNLNRKDLETNVDSYVYLSILIKNGIKDKTLTGTNLHNAVTSQKNLAALLGIDEGLKAKQRSQDDRQSVASLSEQFQSALSEYPMLHDRLKLYELKILLKKYESGELSRAMFELEAFANMSVQDARDWVLLKDKELNEQS